MRIEIAVIELTNNCNLRCRHCYGNFETNTIISINDFEKILNQLYDLGCTKITLSGGEPMLLGEKLVNYAKIAKNKGFPFVYLTTNGTIITANQELFKYFDLVQVSIDGLEDTHDKIRGKGNFIKSVAFIQENLNFCNKMSIMMSVHKDNYYEIASVQKLSKDLGVDFAIELATPCGRGSFIEMLSKYELEFLKGFIKEKKINCNAPISFCFTDNIEIFNNSIKVGCSAGRSALCIDSYLNVYPCARLRTKIGNLKEEHISAILSNKVICDLNDRNKLKGKCGKCFYKFVCGGCRAVAFVQTNNYLEEDNYCVDFVEI